MSSAHSAFSAHGPTAYLDQLNSPQYEAVHAVDGPVLVLAGAGTGKTRVLTTRLTHILCSGYARPHQVLAVTFTNKAASEMRSRVAKQLGTSIEGLWMGTFHAIGVRMLRRHAELANLQPNFTILDMDDQLRLIKQLAKAENLDEKLYPPRNLLSAISRYKDRALTPEAALRAHPGEVAANIYVQYQERLQILNAVDFGDLLLHNINILKKFPEILAEYHAQFRYIMVDEYQDTNIAQYLWLRLLSQASQNLCCVGDDDQSIYGWRGAEVGNILRFEKDFPGAKIIRLEQNYRSTGNIIRAASGVISHNQTRLGKTLWTQDQLGEPVLVRATWDSDNEALFISDYIEAEHRHGRSLNHIAILVRAGFQTRDFEERFLKTGIPYRVIGGLRFYERQEIRDALAYIRLLVQPHDGLAFERIVNLPKRGIGNTTVQTCHNIAREHNVSLPKAAEIFAQTSSRGATCTTLNQFFHDFERWRVLLEHEPHVEVVKMMLDESGYTTMWREDKSPDAAGRLENLKELIAAIGEFKFLPGFLDHVSLVTEMSENIQEEMVTLMTLHAAKGLEFPVVFLTGWEEGLFPHPRCLNESGSAGLEEERRLAYVGISRAREKAIITYSMNRRSYQGWNHALPSRFIKELPLDAIVHYNPGGYEITQGDLVAPKTHNFRPPSPPKQQTYVDVVPITHDFEMGEQIKHPKFGYGRIIEMDGNKLLINFEQVGEKMIMADFVGKTA